MNVYRLTENDKKEIAHIAIEDITDGEATIDDLYNALAKLGVS